MYSEEESHQPQHDPAAQPQGPLVDVKQRILILIDGNNIEYGVRGMTGVETAMLDYDNFVPQILMGRALNKLLYFREGKQISNKLARRFHNNFFGKVIPCLKSAEIPLTVEAVQHAEKVDTMIIFTGNGNFVELLRHLRSRGVRVEIASVKENTSSALLRECDYYHFIAPEDVFVLERRNQQSEESGSNYYPQDGQEEQDNQNFNEPAADDSQPEESMSEQPMQ